MQPTGEAISTKNMDDETNHSSMSYVGSRKRRERPRNMSWDTFLCPQKKGDQQYYHMVERERERVKRVSIEYLSLDR
jgi:hypothetical protein